MYKVVEGDTFERISRKRFGSERFAGLLARANPDLSEPLRAGDVVTIPRSPATLPKTKSVSSSNPDEVALLIDGKQFRFWQSMRITRSIDSVDTIDLSAPFEPSVEGFKTTFRPFSFKPIEVAVGGTTLFTGTMIAITPALSESKTIDVSGYATCGVLGDCMAPASAYPIEFNNQTLQDIAQNLLQPFGLSADFKDPAGSAFKRVALEPTQKIFDFLTDLARQRNLLISSAENGNLIFQKPVAGGTPVAKLHQGESPLISITCTFNPQEYFSHITGIGPASVGKKGSKFTIKNDKLQGVLRPFTFDPNDTDEGTLKEAVESKIGRMFGNMVSYRVELNTWRDPNGALWKPNTLINLESEHAMIYKPFLFVIRSVEFNRDADRTTATLELVLRGAFGGPISGGLPWD